MSGANKHPYHLVEASPWPAVGAAAAFTAAVGGVMYMHEVAHGVTVLAIGMVLVAGCLACLGLCLGGMLGGRGRGRARGRRHSIV